MPWEVTDVSLRPVVFRGIEDIQNVIVVIRSGVVSVEQALRCADHVTEAIRLVILKPRPTAGTATEIAAESIGIGAGPPVGGAPAIPLHFTGVLVSGVARDVHETAVAAVDPEAVATCGIDHLLAGRVVVRHDHREVALPVVPDRPARGVVEPVGGERPARPVPALVARDVDPVQHDLPVAAADDRAVARGDDESLRAGVHGTAGAHVPAVVPRVHEEDLAVGVGEPRVLRGHVARRGRHRAGGGHLLAGRSRRHPGRLACGRVGGDRRLEPFRRPVVVDDLLSVLGRDLALRAGLLVPHECGRADDRIGFRSRFGRSRNGDQY